MTKWKAHYGSDGYEVADSEAARHGRSVMEQKIALMRPTGLALMRRVHEDMPADRVAYGSRLAFVFDDELDVEPSALVQSMAEEHGAATREEDKIPTLLVQIADQTSAIHDNALRQMAQRARVPMDYLGRLLKSEHAPMRDLARQMLNRHYSAQPDNANARYLVRSVRGTVRGFLSDKYRRLNSAQLLDAFAGACSIVGAVPGAGTYTDTRIEMTAYLPRVFEPVPNEVMMVGLSWKNSDYGHGKHALALTILRVVCTNKATMEDVLGQVHIGGRLTDDIEFSERTYRLDTETTCSALRDLVTQYLGADKVNNLMETIRNAHEKGMEWKNVRTALERVLLKNEAAAVRAAFESDDVINLPPGNTAWRMSNAVSWFAHNVEDQGRQMELAAIAGAIAGGKSVASVLASLEAAE